jgi:hypothetical protein
MTEAIIELLIGVVFVVALSMTIDRISKRIFGEREDVLQRTDETIPD